MKEVTRNVHSKIHHTTNDNRVYRHWWDVPLLVGIGVAIIVASLIIIGSLCGWLS